MDFGFFDILAYSCFSSYNNDVKNYERAQQDFEKFQKEEVRKNKMQKEMEEYRQRNAPKCPMCSSTNIKKYLLQVELYQLLLLV